MPLLPWHTGKVIRMVDETFTTRRYWIQVEELSVFDFKPGQFVTLDLPIDPKPHKRLRSYSIASWPDGTNVFELVIVLDIRGTGTKYLFNEVREGSELKFRGPQGVFLLNEPIDKDIFMICTGTGIAPFRSMVHQIKNQQIPHQLIYLVFGCRTKDTLLYFDEMVKLQGDFPGFHFIPTLSREKWEGKMGYVHDIYQELCTERKPAAFYLCGWRAMIDEAVERIRAMGYGGKDVHQEIYG